jgi:hypothetical protein
VNLVPIWLRARRVWSSHSVFRHSRSRTPLIFGACSDFRSALVLEPSRAARPGQLVLARCFPRCPCPGLPSLRFFLVPQDSTAPVLSLCWELRFSLQISPPFAYFVSIAGDSVSGMFLATGSKCSSFFIARCVFGLIYWTHP